MGFKVPKQTITLQFTDEDYAGLEIETKMPTVRDAMAGEKLQKEAEGKSEVTQMTLLFEFLMQFITKWNLEEEDGTPIPLSKEVLLDFPAAFAWDIFHAFF